ncbi:amino acid adenylation domain-containing protein, partial [Herbaspirillum sp. GCM10030257]|uniref:non-ribosomal peptide synthetase n=1 Tax=Herbaspirillum sp. GCM10030257 TaxID=3273393 RepID=UPI0036105544
MTVDELLKQLGQDNVTLSVKGAELAVHGKRQALAPSLVALLRHHKDALIEMIRSGQYEAPKNSDSHVPDNGIPPDCTRITPDMLPLATLSEEQLQSLVDAVPGGAPNVQDIYPLAPLQEGILFHHLAAEEGDPYLLHALFGFDSREQLDHFVAAMQAVVDRHDILRTAIIWKGMPEPLQVVLRRVVLQVEEVAVDNPGGDVVEQLSARFNARRYRLDVSNPPLLRLCIAHDPSNGRWVAMSLFHHLVMDHTTMEIMREEVDACMRGMGHLLPAPVSFRNLVVQARRGISRELHEAFFRRLLGDIHEPIAPFGVLDNQGSGAGITDSWRSLEDSLALRLRAQARTLGVSLAAFCHVAWAQVLARVCGRPEVVFGTVLAGRMQSGHGSDRALGMFINTLPIRLSIGESDVRRALHDTHALLADLIRHEHASLLLAQRCSGVEAPAPLFTSFLNYRFSAAPEQGREAPVTVVEPSDPGQGITFLGSQERSNYPLCLNIDDLGVGLALNIQAQSPIEAERVCSYMHTALAGLAAALETGDVVRVGDIDILPQSERRLLLKEWNATKAAYPSMRCVHELFEERAATAPDAVALEHGGEELAYGELNARANRLAHHLRKRGVGPDARVALCMERGIDMVVGLLAVLKAGGAYVPLDGSYPAERLEFMLRDSAPVALLTHERISARVHATLRLALAGSDAAVIDLEQDAQRWARQPSTNPERASLVMDHLAYLIYTSGSTGQPKGVMVRHAGFTNYLHWAQQTYRPDQGSVVSSSLSFDATITSLFTPLIHGSRVRLLNEGRELEELEERVQDARGCGLVKITPAHLDVLGQRLLAQGTASAVGVFVIGGEALPPSTVEQWRRIQPGVRLINEYGPTETVVGCVVYDIAPEDALEGAVPIGRPIANTRIYLLDERLRPVPLGVAGELYIGGAGVARGYLNRPELNDERFLADPFAGEAGARMYRTGDLARYRDDGMLEYLGRNDFQVKIRGFRIELGEIEARLATHTGVREVAVLAREDSPGDKRLVAYYTCTEAGPDAEALRAHVAEALPDYMVPALYVRLDALPLTANGKLDRQALHAEGGRQGADERAYTAPQGELETTLAHIWEEVLGLEKVGRNDNFFRLGGHSLLAVKVASRMYELGIQADVRALFNSPTLADLADAMQKAGSVKPANEAFDAPVAVPPQGIDAQSDVIRPGMLPLVSLTQAEIDRIVATVPGGAANVQDIYPLAPLQEGILFHHLASGKGDVYLSSALFSFDSRDLLDHFMQSLQAVIDRHDILRTAVQWEGLAEPLQVVWR